jgi:glucose-6-phosphate isomerase
MLTGNVTQDVPAPDDRSGDDPSRLSRLQLTQRLGEVRALRERSQPVIRPHFDHRWAGIAHLLEAAQKGRA